MTKTEDQSSSSRRPMTRRLVVQALGIGGGLLFAPSIVRAQEKGVLKVGAIQAVTGQSAAPGVRGRDGAILAMEDINKAGGWTDPSGKQWTVEVDTQDMANDPKQAITLMRQFASDPSILAVIGPTSSVGYVPLVPVAAQLQFPLIGSGSGAPIKRWNIYSYRVNPVSYTAVPVLLRTVVKLEKIKTLAVIYDQTQDGNLADAVVCKQMAAELGYNVSAYEAFRAGDQDFSPQIARIRVTNPDAIYAAAAPSDLSHIVPQIRGVGIDKPLLTGFGGFDDPVVWDATNGGTKGCYTWLAQDLNAPGADLKTVIDRYNARFSTPANSFSTYGYDALFVILEAFKKANGAYDRGKFLTALQSLDVKTPLGTHVTFKNPPSGDNLNPTVVSIEIDGRGTYKTVS